MDAMKKKICNCFILVFVLFSLAQVSLSAEQANKWWKGHAHLGEWGEDSQWFNSDNWFTDDSEKPLPDGEDIVDLNAGTGIEPVIDANNVGDNKAVCRALYLPYYQEGNTPCHLYMTGGILEVGEDFIIGMTDQASESDPNERDLDVGILEMSGGTITIDVNLSVGGYGNEYGCAGGHGTINMTGGLIICESLRIPEGNTPGAGVVNLDGGIIQAQNFIMNPNEPNGLMYITDGRLILDGNQVDIVNDYIDSSWLLVGDPNYSLVVNYISSTSLTQVIAVDLRRAWNPNPEDGALRIPYNVILSWNAGTTASDTNGHDVYLGTDQTSVENATVQNQLGVYIGRQTATSFDTEPLSLEKGIPYYWRIDEVNELTEPDTIFKGLVWTFTLDDGKAYDPSPGDNSTGVPIDKILTWSTGSFSDGTHQVYFGTSYEDVNSATTGYVTRSEPNYSPDTLLNMDQSYYWRVDEVNGVAKLKGHVWSFTTSADYLIDDFEAYDGDNLIEDTWITSDTVQVEDANVYQGNQAMRFSYSGTADANRTFDPNQDWTALGVKALRLYFYGLSGNTGGPFSVSLEDTDGDIGTVSYPDFNDVNKVRWVEWNISAQDFAAGNMDLDKVKRVRISVGGSGSGDIYIDYIQVFVSRCLPGYGPDVDFTGDCFVDVADLNGLTDAWLFSGYDVYAAASLPALKVYYDFNETDYYDDTAYDKSGNGYDANYVQDPNWPYTEDAHWNPNGKIGGCLEFNGHFGMSVPSAAFNMLTNNLTIAFWIKGLTIESAGGTWPTMFHASTDSNDYVMLAQWYSDAGPIPDPELTYGMGRGWISWPHATPEDYYDDWNHYTFVKKKSTGEMTIYLNGIPVSKTNDANDTLSTFQTTFHIGGATSQYPPNYLEALMDDFRIYDSALTNEQVVKLLGLSSVHVPLAPLLSPCDPYADDKIDLHDFAKVAEYWFEIPLWP